MAWAAVPVLANTDVLKAAFDEVRAAIVERYLVLGAGTIGLQTSAANGDQPRALLTNYRTFIENAISSYVNPAAGYAHYSKATLLAATIGAADWVANPDPVPQQMYIRELNELRSVLNGMAWAALNPVQGGQNRIALATSAVSWDAAWTAAKVSYAATPWGGADLGVRFLTTASFVAPDYYEYIRARRELDLQVSIADVDTVAAVMRLTSVVHSDGGPGVGAIDIHQQANFGGAAIPLNILATGDSYVPVASPAKNATAHYSMRSNPVDPNPDSYRAADVSVSNRGFEVVPWKLLVHFAFAYGP